MKTEGTITGRWSTTPNCRNIDKSEWCSVHYTNRPHICRVKPHIIMYFDIDYAEVERRVIAVARDRKRSDWICLYDEVREYFRRQPRVMRFDKKQIVEIMDTIETKFLRCREEEHVETANKVPM